MLSLILNTIWLVILFLTMKFRRFSRRVIELEHRYKQLLLSLCPVIGMQRTVFMLFLCTCYTVEVLVLRPTVYIGISFNFFGQQVKETSDTYGTCIWSFQRLLLTELPVLQWIYKDQCLLRTSLFVRKLKQRKYVRVKLNFK